MERLAEIRGELHVELAALVDLNPRAAPSEVELLVAELAAGVGFVGAGRGCSMARAGTAEAGPHALPHDARGGRRPHQPSTLGGGSPLTGSPLTEWRRTVGGPSRCGGGVAPICSARARATEVLARCSSSFASSQPSKKVPNFA